MPGAPTAAQTIIFGECIVFSTTHGLFVWGFIKSKVYVRNYTSLDELKESITAAFEELTPQMVTSTLKNMEKRLQAVIERKGGHIENK